MTVEGSYQMNEGQPIRIARVYDQRKEVAGGNGKSYVLEGQPIMGTRLTVKDQLAAHPGGLAPRKLPLRRDGTGHHAGARPV